MKEGNVAGTLSKVVGNADMLHKINTIQPNCLSPLMKHVFSPEPIQTGLTELADKLPVVSGPALDLKNCLWATPVDFREGVFAIDGIKSSLESCKEAVGALQSSSSLAVYHCARDVFCFQVSLRRERPRRLLARS